MGPRYILRLYVVKNQEIALNSATTEAKIKHKFGIFKILENF
jgi:hypothetical protein